MRQTALDKPPMRDRKSPVPGWRDASFGLSVTQMGVVEGPPRGRNSRLPPDHDSSTAPRSVSATVAGRNGLGSDSTDGGGGQGRRPGRPRSGVGRYDLRGPPRQVVGRISGVPSTWGPGDFHRRRRRAPRPRAAGIAGQLPRVRGRTPGLPPQGVALHCGKSVWSRRRGTRGGGRRGLPRSVHKLLRLSMAGVPSAGRTRSPRCDAILTMKEDALGGFHA